MIKSVLFATTMALAVALIAPIVSAQAPALTPEELAEIQAAAATPPPPEPQRVWRAEPPNAIIYASDFETDNGGLTGVLDWEWGTYAWSAGSGCNSTVAPPPAPHSGEKMWGTVLNDCYNPLGNHGSSCTNTTPKDDSILTLNVDLTGLSQAQLKWWDWPDLFMDWDWGEVRINGDLVFQHCGSGYTAPTAWTEQKINLTPYVGGPVTITFHMVASSVVNYSGWYIDDIEVNDDYPVELMSFSAE